MDNGEQNRPGARLLLKTIGAYAGAAALATLSVGIDYLYLGRLTGRLGDFPNSGAFAAGTYATLALTYLTVKAFGGANQLRKALSESARATPKPDNIIGITLH